MKIVLAGPGGEGLSLSGRSAATIQLGREGIIHGARTLVMQTEDGQIEEPYSISAGLIIPASVRCTPTSRSDGRAKVVAVDDDGAARGFRADAPRRDHPRPRKRPCPRCAAPDGVPPSDVVVLTVSGRGDKDMETYLANMDRPEISGNL